MSRNLDDLHQIVKEQAVKLQLLAKEMLNLNIIFTQTLRTNDEQKALYAQGRLPLEQTNALRKLANLGPITGAENRRIVTKAQTVKNSFHGYGLAFDIAVTDPTGRKIDWTDSADWNYNSLNDWTEIGKLGVEIGLEWGGNWSGMCDPPHFQNRLGYTLAELRSGNVTL